VAPAQRQIALVATDLDLIAVAFGAPVRADACAPRTAPSRAATTKTRARSKPSDTSSIGLRTPRSSSMMACSSTNTFPS
jgi:hypothetical protein